MLTHFLAIPGAYLKCLTFECNTYVHIQINASAAAAATTISGARVEVNHRRGQRNHFYENLRTTTCTGSTILHPDHRTENFCYSFPFLACASPPTTDIQVHTYKWMNHQS